MVALGGGCTTTKLPQAVEDLIRARTADAVFVVDQDYRIVHWDARVESLTGLLAEEMIGKPCYEALQGECEGGYPFSEQLCAVVRLAYEGYSAPSYDVDLFARSAGRRWVNVSTLTVDAEEGPYLVHLMRDSQKAHDTLEMAQALVRLSCPKNNSDSALHQKDVSELTPRQLEILELLGEGKAVKEIGKELYLSQATVRNHVRSLLQALRAHSQLEAVAKAHKSGLLPR